MVRTIAVLRGVAKTVGWLLLALFATVVVWFAANRLLDPAPSPERKALSGSADARIEDSGNAAVGILGLTAPKGSDFIQHGIRVKALRAHLAHYWPAAHHDVASLSARRAPRTPGTDRFVASYRRYPQPGGFHHDTPC